MDENQQNWDLLIDPILFAMRTERQRSTKYSPFEIMFGRTPKYPMEIAELETCELQVKHNMLLLLNYIFYKINILFSDSFAL